MHKEKEHEQFDFRAEADPREELAELIKRATEAGANDIADRRG